MKQFIEKNKSQSSIKSLFHRVLFGLIFSCVFLDYRPGCYTGYYGASGRSGNIWRHVRTYYSKYYPPRINPDFQGYWELSFNASFDLMEDFEALPYKKPVIPPDHKIYKMVREKKVKVKKRGSIQVA